MTSMMRMLRCLALGLGVLAACPYQCGGGKASAGPAEPAATERQATYQVKQVSCHGCVVKIEKGLAAKNGIEHVDVDTDKGHVIVRFDAAKTDAETIRKAIEDLGYPAKLLDEQAVS